MERIVKPMPPEMKKELAKKTLAKGVNEKIHALDTFSRTKFSEPKDRNTLILPEEFTGSDLRKAKRYIRQYRVRK